MRSVVGEGPGEPNSRNSGAQEEKIFVAVRLRPLNAKELAKNEVSDWECINSTTILFRNSLQDRSLAPTPYTFDRVFGGNCSTSQVYEESAKKIALSVLSGINSTIFAYGQTSSGKTYTMSGITECAVADIYDYINKHPERKYVMKFSALEIYNETVKDLLCPDGAPLRLRDDSERGTIVDKLTEVIPADADHLFELLSYCEAQRQTGETHLNERSSRSHQILRLTIESKAHQHFGVESISTLSATVNFVDLAGSERASQTLSRGTRLKEGSHINRSLLTLGTVVRKLSKGRNGHIPYRDSKLTRILQNALGGNARTMIICTLSAARSQVEQSKNTLVFASCAKQVSTNSRINVSMSEKALVKQLQTNLTNLENELRNLRSISAASVSASALKEKELLIEKMEIEMKEIAYQRDLALSRVESMIRSGSSSQTSKSSSDMNYSKKDSDEYSVSEASEIYDPHRFDNLPSTVPLSNPVDGLIPHKSEDLFPENNEEQFFSDNASLTQYIDKYFGPDPCSDWEKIAEETKKKSEDNCTDVQSTEIDSTNTVPVSNMLPMQDEDLASGLGSCSSDDNASDPYLSKSRSSSCAVVVHMTVTESTSFEGPKDNGNEAGNQAEPSIVEAVDDTESEFRKDSMDEEEQSIVDGRDEQEEEVIPLDPEKQIESDMQGMEEERTTSKPEPVEAAEVGLVETVNNKESVAEWSAEYERKIKEIIQLWDACHIPLIHRTYFFLLFKGDPSDAIYIEVELRRLAFLKNSINSAVEDDPSSTKALNRERDMLSRRMLRKISSKEREELYAKWGVDIKSKQRRAQLCQKLWTDTTNMDHIQESAALVSKLMGFKEPGEVTKEMFGLSFTPKPGAFRWRSSLPSMMQGLLETVY
ncbi:kinesin-like protein KIN-7F [Andrographis paniculata]|uniref:kinesin-like protein KIN-7F n=1 Tax=Andrographis paniculata TaxID=175694 RepID=UPI0021E8FCE5|nr:kinesin-like protein KIN-7F [Andrographis paniculata]